MPYYYIILALNSKIRGLTPDSILADYNVWLLPYYYRTLSKIFYRIGVDKNNRMMYNSSVYTSEVSYGGDC